MKFYLNGIIYYQESDNCLVWSTQQVLKTKKVSDHLQEVKKIVSII